MRRPRGVPGRHIEQVDPSRAWSDGHTACNEPQSFLDRDQLVDGGKRSGT